MREKELRKLLTKLGIKPGETDGDWIICQCCFTWKHKGGRDETPSLGIKIEPTGRSGYHCFSCHSKGSLPNLIFQLGKHRDDSELLAFGRKVEMDEILGSDEIEFEEWGNAKNNTTTKARIKVKFPDFREAYARYPSALSSDRALSYCRRRRIPVNTIAEIGLRYDPRQQRLLFPVWDYWTGRFAGFSGRVCWSENKRKRIERERRKALAKPRYKIPKIRDYAGLTKRAVLLSPPRYRGSTRPANIESYLILVEGLVAYSRLTALGFTNVRALLGSELTVEKADILRDIGVAVYWFTDNDLAGQQCLYGSYNFEQDRFEGGGAIDILYGDIAQLTVTWPEGKTDPDDLTREEVESMIENAEFFVKS